MKMGESSEELISVKINFNYTITLLDRKGKSLTFRDITGRDLEFLDHVLEIAENEGKPFSISSDKVISILSRISLDDVDFKKFPVRILFLIFAKVQEVILGNYIPKLSWLKACYGIQNGSFVNVLDMEKVPMSKFMVMIKIHEEAIESINKQ